jgi:hypothetical protein
MRMRRRRSGFSERNRVPNESDRELKENRQYEVNVCGGIDIWIDGKEEHKGQGS